MDRDPGAIDDRARVALSGGPGLPSRRALHRAWDPRAVTTAWHDPRRSDLLTQRMSRESDALREPFMLEQLLGTARQGARVFAEVGEGHVCHVRAGLERRWSEQDAGASIAEPR